MKEYLPCWAPPVVVAAAVLTLLLNLFAGWWAHHSGYRGLADAGESLDAMCTASPPPFKLSAEPGTCHKQLLGRASQAKATQASLEVACERRGFFENALRQNIPEARRSLKEEALEIRQSFGRLRELSGPKMSDELTVELLLIAFTMAMIIGATYLAAMHAKRVGIRPPGDPAQFRTPFLWALGANGGVASAVLYRESVDPKKSGFDWDSYCICEPASWIAHASVLLVAVVCAASLALGWYFSRTDHVPKADATLPRWGVGGYVSFLETWSFAIVMLVGVLEAGWVHDLAAAPSRTNITVAFLGAGALAGAGVLVVRFVRCALSLRKSLEAIIKAGPARDKWPADPTDGILGQRWWQLPALFVVAGGLAYQLLDSAGVARLWHGAP